MSEKLKIDDLRKEIGEKIKKLTELVNEFETSYPDEQLDLDSTHRISLESYGSSYPNVRICDDSESVCIFDETKNGIESIIKLDLTSAINLEDFVDMEFTYSFEDSEYKDKADNINESTYFKQGGVRQMKLKFFNRKLKTSQIKEEYINAIRKLNELGSVLLAKKKKVNVEYSDIISTELVSYDMSSIEDDILLEIKGNSGIKLRISITDTEAKELIDDLDAKIVDMREGGDGWFDDEEEDNEDE